MHVYNTVENKKAIMKLCCEVCGVPMTDALSKSRKRIHVTPRQIACKIYKDNMLLGLKEIASLVSYKGQDHSTVINSIQIINNMIDTNDAYTCNHYDSIMKRLPSVIVKPNTLVISYTEGFPIDKIVEHIKTKKNVSYEFKNT